MQRDSEEIDKVLWEISRVWKKFPHLRLGQLITYALQKDWGIYGIDDSELLRQLREYADKHGVPEAKVVSQEQAPECLWNPVLGSGSSAEE